MEHLPIHTRQAVPADHAEIAGLLCQLGYKIDAAQVLAKLNAMQGSSADLVLLASKEDKIIGCISLHVLAMFHRTGSLGRITSLVADREHRGQGIGKALMAAAHQWFIDNECVKLEVTSADQRLDAHRFYESLGFERDGQRFSREV
ncbi:GNAT family N-acetyltransferase [Herbaspirillum lusitanum]|uniref:GNAT family N-acetyltransferase n=1 Tax=Herbaspirillum lusitanum TaxID=213312 RepID=A0ABW9AHK8_9BURK